MNLLRRIIAAIRNAIPLTPSEPLPDQGASSVHVSITITGPVFVEIHEDADMSLITQKLDALEAAVNAEVTQGAQLAESVDALKAQVAELQAKIDEGTVTPEELARFDALTAKVESIVNPPVTPPTE